MNENLPAFQKLVQMVSSIPIRKSQIPYLFELGHRVRRPNFEEMPNLEKRKYKYFCQCQPNLLFRVTLC